MNSGKTKIFFLGAFFFFIYLLLPTRNSTIDAWCFAANVKNGESLFLSHHLFYNAIGFIWVKLVGLIYSGNELKLLIGLNAIFAAATLYVLGLTLKQLGVEFKQVLIWVAFAGSSWAIMRFATENETYIIPLFFSTLGSYFFVKNLNQNSNRNLIYSGLFAAMACLFHQIMFFWWLSLLIGIIFTQRIKPLVFFALSALLVPLFYILVIVYYYHQPLGIESLFRFIFNDFYSGAAGISTGLSSLMFTSIGIIRSFFQVHGYIALLPNLSKLFIIGGAISVGFIIMGLFYLRRIRIDLKSVRSLPVWVHLLAITLQLIFAFLSTGNAEFMVMIPILLAISIPQIIKNEILLVGFISVGMLVWNISLGLVPLNQYTLDSNSFMAQKVIQSQQDKKNHLFVLFNKPAVENRIDYYTGKPTRNIISGTQYDSIFDVRQRIISAIENDSTVLTDCINRPSTLSRETLIFSNKCNILFEGLNQLKVDSVETLNGRYFFYQISAQ